MGCACGGSKKRGTGIEYEIKFRDGTKAVVPDIATARSQIQARGGGTFRPVAKSRQAG